MKLSKSLICITFFSSLFIVSSSYSQPSHPAVRPITSMNTATISAAEKATLATIAAIDENEILVSVVALHKNLDTKLTDFANMMIDQHGSNLTQILEMANTLRALPLTSKEGETLTAQGRIALSKLGGLKDKPFEIAYADAMVTGHEAALHLIDQKLMKTAQSPEIKKFMLDTRAVVAQHLEHAKKLQASLK